MCIFGTSTLTVAEFNITRVSSKELYLVFIVGGSEVIKLSEKRCEHTEEELQLPKYFARRDETR
jgi:hypothetical protein